MYPKLIVDYFIKSFSQRKEKSLYLYDFAKLANRQGHLFSGGFLVNYVKNQKSEVLFISPEGFVFADPHPAVRKFINIHHPADYDILFDSNKGYMYLSSFLRDYQPLSTSLAEEVKSVYEITLDSPRKRLRRFLVLFNIDQSRFEYLAQISQLFLSFYAEYNNNLILAPTTNEDKNLIFLYEELKLHQEELLVQNEHLHLSELSLLKAVEYFETLFDSAPVCLAEISDTGLVQRLNHHGQRFLSVHKNILTDFGFPLKTKVKLTNFLDSEENFIELPTAITNRKGKKQYGILRMVTIANQNNREKRLFLLTFEDKTDSFLMEKMLKQHLEDIMNLINATKSHFILFDALGKVVAYNKEGGEQLAKLFNTEIKKGEQIFNLLDGGYKYSLQKYFERALMGESIAEVVYLGALGNLDIKWADIKFIPIKDLNGHVHQICYILNDITITKEREAELAKLAMVAERTINGVVITNAERKIEWVNQGFERLTEYTLDEVIGRKPGDFLQSPDTDPEEIIKMRIAFKQHQSVSTTLLNVTKSGRKYYVNVQIEPIFDVEGELIKFFAIQTDVTNDVLQKQELNLRTQKLSAAKDELASLVYRISHDLRAPVLSSLGLLSIMQMPQEQSNLKYYFDLQERSLRKMDEYIIDIVSLVRNERFEVQISEIDIENIYNKEISKIKHLNSDVNIEAEFEIGAPVFTDQYRLELILGNILSNGLKYADAAKDSIIKIKFKVFSDKIEIRYSDNGLGINPTYLDEVFKLFFRAHDTKSGSGIGLYLVKQAIEVLGGNIKVQSAEGVGTKFDITMPNFI